MVFTLDIVVKVFKHVPIHCQSKHAET